MLPRVEKEPSMPRGTELLDGIGLVLPNLNYFDDEQDLGWATVTDVLSTYCTTDAARPISAPPAASILSQRISRRPISMTTTRDWFAT
jgi:hypothetical protein